MNRLLNPATAVLLGLVLAMTSVSMAVARGGMSMTGSMILCIDAEQQIVPIGPDGEPMQVTHACPDCTIGALALTGLQPLDAPEWRMALLYARPFTLLVHETTVQGGQGRGPPSRI
ncbi:hypothetical protein [Nioella aestuarii]|uniref:hypothetical protein n=1 Tax=Nioella aestuarii TaxID=1662864 RepID=UPI003D7F9CEE